MKDSPSTALNVGAAYVVKVCVDIASVYAEMGLPVLVGPQAGEFAEAPQRSATSGITLWDLNAVSAMSMAPDPAHNSMRKIILMLWLPPAACSCASGS